MLSPRITRDVSPIMHGVVQGIVNVGTDSGVLPNPSVVTAHLYLHLSPHRKSFDYAALPTVIGVSIFERFTEPITPISLCLCLVFHWRSTVR